MRAFKKRTIALVLASVVTVVGAFGAENYKNSLMGLSFKQNSEGFDLVVQTRLACDADIVPMRKDQNTYIVMLPEMDSQAITPNLNKVAGNISSVDIQTMPYTNGSRGYTRITVKTSPSTILGVEKQVFVPGERYRYLEHSSSDEDRRSAIEHERRLAELRLANSNQNVATENSTDNEQLLAQQRAQELKKKQEELKSAELARKKQQEVIEKAKRQAEEIQKSNEEAKVISTQEPPSVEENSSSGSVVSDDYYEDNNLYLYILGGILLLGLIAYFIVKAKNKLQELTGEQIVIDVSNEDETEKQKKEKKVKEDAKKLEKKAKKPQKQSKTTMVDVPYSVASKIPEPVTIETVNVVDLDEIFKEQSKSQGSDDIDEDENAALEDFLSGFSFDDEMLEEEYSPGYDVELYEKIINNPNCKFSKEDVEKINKLMNMEINDSTLKNIEKYAVSNPIKKQPSKKQILEEFVTTYAVSQNVIFTKDDIGALYKLISVEIDSDFITNLKTDPQRVKEMEDELTNRAERPKKPSELLTLNVKDVLPDLSEALRKQGGRAIQSEVKPQTVYFSEGYEVSKLTLDTELPDLSVEINNKDAYVSKPSEKYELVDNSYDVSRLKISSQLPDLVDMLQNPDKYKKEEPVIEVNEEDLLKNISNVQFKPFYDGEDIEVINNVEDFDETTVIDIQKELSQFDNIEIVDEDSDSIFDELNIQEVDSLYQNSHNAQNVEEQSVDEEISNDSLEIEDGLASNEESAVPEDVVTTDVDSNPVFEDLLEEDENVVKDNIVQEVAPEPVVQHEKEVSAIEQKTEDAVVKEVFSKVDNINIRAERPRSRVNTTSQDLLKRIEDVKTRRVERNERINSTQNSSSLSVTESKSSKVIADIKCIFEGQTYTVISTAHFIGRAGCYLAKNENGYMVLGHYGEKLFNLRQYETLKSEKIQTRLSEKLPEDTYRYLVRIGINKFVVDVSGENITYVMDLC